MADKLIAFPEYGASGGQVVPILASEITPGVYSLNVGAELTLDPTNLALEATQASILAKIIAAPATAAKQDTLAAIIGSVSDSAWSGSGDGTVIAILKAIAVNTVPVP